MSTTTPTPETVLEACRAVGPPGTPFTKADVAERFDCSERTVYNRLETLVEQEHLKTKKVGARGRVWWEPATRRDRAGSNAQLDAYRVALADRIRSVTDPMEIQYEAARLLGERLGTDRALYVEVLPDAETLQVTAGYPREKLEPVSARHSFSDFGADIVDQLRRGEPVVVSDVSEVSSGDDLAAYRAIDVAAYLTVPLLRDDRLVGLVTLHQSTPREWGETAIDMTRETVERTWDAVERARSEQELEATNETLERLTEAARELISADEPTIRTRVTELAREVLGCAYASLWRYDETTGELGRDAQTGDEIDAPDGLDEQAWETFLGDGVDVDNDIAGDGDLRSRMLVPLGRHGVLCVGSTRPGAFDKRTADLVETVGATVESAWDRAEGEAELARRNEELTRLDQLNTLIRDIHQSLVEADSVEAIDATVCERLCDSSLYEFAWIGEYDGRDVRPRARAGVDATALETLAQTTGGGSHENPILAAVTDGETQRISDIATDPRATPWREVALDQGARSCLCIPLVYNESGYGVLTVYGRTPQQDERDADILEELGRTIAHAVNAVETRRWHSGDTVVELTLRTTAVQSPLVVLARESDTVIEFDGLVPGAQAGTTVFFTATDADPERVLQAGRGSLAVEAIDHVVDTDVGGLFKARLSDAPIASHLLDRGATIGSLTADGEGVTAVVELADSTDVREFLDDLERAIPGIELLARRSRLHSLERERRLRSAFEERLTQRQRDILRLAYRSGFFESPRRRTGQQLSDAVELSQSTFNYHLRRAERTLFGAVFDAHEP